MPTTAARLAHPATPSYTPATPANPHTGGLLCRASGVEGALPRAGRVSSSRLSRHASPPVVAQPSRPFTRQPTPRQGTYPQVIHKALIHKLCTGLRKSYPHPASQPARLSGRELIHKLSTSYPQGCAGNLSTGLSGSEPPPVHRLSTNDPPTNANHSHYNFFARVKTCIFFWGGGKTRIFLGA